MGPHDVGVPAVIASNTVLLVFVKFCTKHVVKSTELKVEDA
jgi:hypothetical protein